MQAVYKSEIAFSIELPRTRFNVSESIIGSQLSPCFCTLTAANFSFSFIKIYILDINYPNTINPLSAQIRAPSGKNVLLISH